MKSKIKSLLADGSKTVPFLCRHIPNCNNEFAMMRAIAELEERGEVCLEGFDRIFREDGGAIYLAKYGLPKGINR